MNGVWDDAEPRYVAQDVYEPKTQRVIVLLIGRPSQTQFWWYAKTLARADAHKSRYDVHALDYSDLYGARVYGNPEGLSWHQRTHDSPEEARDAAVAWLMRAEMSGTLLRRMGR